MLTPEQKADEARRILDSDVFKEVVESVKDAYYQRWLGSTSEKEREDLHARTRVFDDVLRELRTLRDRGTVAQHQRRAR